MSRRTKLYVWCATVTALASATVLARAPHTPGTTSAQIADLQVALHDAGPLHLTVSQWGMIGSWPNTGYPFSGMPSAQWPGGSGIEYLFGGGLWVGARIDTIALPLVSTAFNEFEFLPQGDARDVIYSATEGMPAGERYPSLDADDDGDGRVDEEWQDGYDDDGDGEIDEDVEAISAQMLSSWYVDDHPDAVAKYPRHRPLHLRVRERSLQWREDDYDDLVGFEYEVCNTGPDTLKGVYLGFWHDLDAGHRDSSAYYNDDLIAMTTVLVDHGIRGGMREYYYVYVRDADGDGGQTPGAFGMVLLDHTTDTGGVEAPLDVRLHSYHVFASSGWPPISDYERYAVMASGTFEPPTAVPRDYNTVVSVGPFPRMSPGACVTLAVAMVAAPNDGSFANVRNAARLYHGEWFDIDRNPATGVDGKERQVHWFIPGDVPMHFGDLDAAVSGAAVDLSWTVTEGATPVAGFRIQRQYPGGAWEDVIDGYLPPDTRAFTDTRADRGRDYTFVVWGADTRGRETRSPYARATIPVAASALLQNYPNPFNPATVIPFTLTKRQQVILAVYDASGRRVATLVNGTVDAGLNEFVWDGTTDAGDQVASGVYFLRLVAEGVEQSKKMVVAR